MEKANNKIVDIQRRRKESIEQKETLNSENIKLKVELKNKNSELRQLEKENKDFIKSNKSDN